MKLFAILCLAFILIAIQHVLQIMWRGIHKAEDIDKALAILGGVFATAIAFLITYFCGIVLAQWIIEYYDTFK